MNIGLPLPLLSLVLLVVSAPVFAASELDLDFDGDGIINRFDNCLDVHNVSQIDADADGYGNPCDPDLNNDGAVNFLDVALFGEFFSTNNVVADFNADGLVNFLDVITLRDFFNQAPGPVAVINWNAGDGDWYNAQNWLPTMVPTVDFHVVIDVPGDVTVTQSQNIPVTVASIEIGETLELCGSLTTFENILINGVLRAACLPGSLTAEEIIVGGTAFLNEFDLNNAVFSNAPDAEGQIIIDRNGFFQANNTTFGVDVVGLPGSVIFLSGQTSIVADAVIQIQSRVDDFSSLFLEGSVNSAVGDAGYIEFEGPPQREAATEVNFQSLASIGENVTLSISQGAFANFQGLDTQNVNLGTIRVSEFGTLVFNSFGQSNGGLTNNGLIECSSNGRIYTELTQSGQPGYFDFVNGEDGQVTADNCSLNWPQGLTSAGQFIVTESDLVLPFINGQGGDVPVSVTDSDVQFAEFADIQPVLLSVLDISSNNSFLLDTTLFLFGQTINIDAEKWSFGETATLADGTLSSPSSFNVGSQTSLTLTSMTLETDVTVNGGADLIVLGSLTLQDATVTFEVEDCESIPNGNSSRLRVFEGNLNGTGEIQISGDPTAEFPCHDVEITSETQDLTISAGIDISVEDTSLQFQSQDGRRITLQGGFEIAGGSDVQLSGVTNTGAITCFDLTPLNPSYINSVGFINEGSLSVLNCNVELYDDWVNNGDISITGGRLLLGSFGDDLFVPSSGTFNINFAQVEIGQAVTTGADLFGFNMNESTLSLRGEIIEPSGILNMDEYPSYVVFASQSLVTGKTITGSVPLRATGNAEFVDVVLQTDLEISSSESGGNSSVRFFGETTLDNASIIIRSAVTQNVSQSNKALLNSQSTLSGAGSIVFEALGGSAASALEQTSNGMPVTIGSGIDVNVSGSGTARIKAGNLGGIIELFGPVEVDGIGAELQLLSSANLYGRATVLDRGLLSVSGPLLKFTGSESGFVYEIPQNAFNATGLRATGNSSLDISEASLVLLASPDYVVANGDTLLIAQHSGGAERVGEFADISEAVVDGVVFTPDYSSPDATVFIGPVASPAGVME